MWTRIKKFVQTVFRPAKVKIYIKRLKFAYEMLEKYPDEGPKGLEREATIETVVWLIRYYKGHPDAVIEGTPEIKLAKLLRTSSHLFNTRQLATAKVLSHWTQYKHIEGY